MLLTRFITIVLVVLGVVIQLQAAGSEVADAAMRGDTAALARLIREGADVNQPQVDSATALHWAIYRGDRESADLLIGAGAKVSAANRLGITPLAMAALYGDARLVDALVKAAVRMLLELGLDPNQANNEGRSPLMGAALKGRLDVIQLLVDRGANLAAHDRGSRDTHIPGATIAGFTFQAIDYAEGLVRVGVQSAVERPEAVKLIRQLMQERNLPVPPAGRTLNSICVVALCQGSAQ